MTTLEHIWAVIENAFAHLRHHTDPVNNPAPSTPLPPAPAAAPVTGVVAGSVASSPAPANTPVSNAWNPALAGYAASGDVRGANAGGTVPQPAGAPAGYEGHDLTPGNPRINVETGGVPAEYRFNGPGVVYYQICEGCDSGMRVTSWVLDAAGSLIVPTETRVIANKQPFTVSVSGPCRFMVNPEKTGPISVGLE